MLLSRRLASVPEEEEGPKEKQQQTSTQEDSASCLDAFTNKSISRRVRDDIKSVLANSWELREVLLKPEAALRLYAALGLIRSLHVLLSHKTSSKPCKLLTHFLARSHKQSSACTPADVSAGPPQRSKHRCCCKASFSCVICHFQLSGCLLALLCVPE
jgi:hypothetical protein